MTLGEKIRDIRQKKEYSQKDIAEKMGISTGRIAEWESDELTPSLADIVKLSKILDVTVDELIGNIENEATDNQQEMETPPCVPQEEIQSNVDNQEKINGVKKSKRRIFIVAVAAVVVVVMGLLLFTALTPFSKNTKAMADADNSVVQVLCYNFFGEKTATGSGFVVYDDSTIVTNYHVVDGAYNCKISTAQDIIYEVEKVIAYSEEKDIIILQLKESTGLKPLKLGNSDEIKKGSPVTAIGSPLGVKNTISQGVLSGRVLEDEMYVLQFTAAISSGSSGGALFDDSGNVIGVTYASYVDGQNLNLAIPVEEVQSVYNNKISVPVDVRMLCRINYPHIEALEENPDIKRVTLSELANFPERYKDCVIMLESYVSSYHEYTLLSKRSYYLTDQENVSNDDEWDNQVLNNRIYDIVLAFSSVSYALEYDTFPSVGDNVIVIGRFDYFGDFDDRLNFGSISVTHMDVVN